MKIVGAFEAKTHLSAILTDVEKHHEEYEIQRRGIPIATIIPFHPPKEKKLSEERIQEILEGFRNIRRSIKKKVTYKEIKEWINEGRA